MKSKRKSSFKDDSQLYKVPDKKYIQAGYPEEVNVDAVIECWKKRRMKHKTQGQTLNENE
jgi:hypothetical protein